MRRAWLAAAVTAFILGGVSFVSALQPGESLVRSRTDGTGAQTFSVVDGTECWQRGVWVIRPESVPLSACTPPPATTLPPATTTPPSTTTPPVTGGFVETFDAPDSLGRFDFHVYHRNVDLYGFTSFSGGSWSGDHDTSCGTPDTQRSLSFNVNDNQSARITNSVYWCRQHMMTAMGDVDGYSIVTFSPAQTFSGVHRVCVDVNLTDLGTRQWFKVGVVADVLYRSTVNGVPGFLFSDVGASDLPTSMAGADHFIATWSGGVSAGYPGFLKVGNTNTNVQSNPTPNDKMTRHPVCLVDNGDGTVTFTVAGVSATRSGSFPAGAVRVVFYDHNYTPTKSESGYPQGFTWHWDNVIIE